MNAKTKNDGAIWGAIGSAIGLVTFGHFAHHFLLGSGAWMGAKAAHADMVGGVLLGIAAVFAVTLVVTAAKALKGGK